MQNHPRAHRVRTTHSWQWVDSTLTATFLFIISLWWPVCRAPSLGGSMANGWCPLPMDRWLGLLMGAGLFKEGSLPLCPPLSALCQWWVLGSSCSTHDSHWSHLSCLSCLPHLTIMLERHSGIAVDAAMAAAENTVGTPVFPCSHCRHGSKNLLV